MRSGILHYELNWIAGQSPRRDPVYAVLFSRPQESTSTNSSMQVQAEKRSKQNQYNTEPQREACGLMVRPCAVSEIGWPTASVEGLNG